MPKDMSRYRGMYEKGRKRVGLDTPAPEWVGKPHLDRASQFMPFAALKGYDALIDGIDNFVQPRQKPTPEELAVMDETLSRLSRGAQVSLLVYEQGVGYRQISGRLDEVSDVFGWIKVDGQQIMLADIDLLEEC